MKPSLDDYPDIGWTDLDLDQFNMVPKMLRSRLSKLAGGWGLFPHDSDRIGPRLSLRLRVLHRDGLFRRLAALPLQ